MFEQKERDDFRWNNLGLRPERTFVDQQNEALITAIKYCQKQYFYNIYEFILHIQVFSFLTTLAA